MTRFYRTIPILFAFVAAAPSAFAQQPTIRSELTGPARDAWDRAVAAFRAHIFPTALAEYTSAYDLSKNPRVLYNMGICEKELSHFVRASARWEQELREGAMKISPEDKEDLRKAIAAVKAFITTVDVKATEPGDAGPIPLAGAKLYIDDVEVAGQTPFPAPVAVDSGVDRVLKMRKEGYKDAVRPAQSFRVGETPVVTFSLEPVERRTEAHVRVAGAPGAQIVIDGTERGPAPFDGTLSEGPHTIEARAPGYVPATQTVTVAYKKPVTLTLSLSAERHDGRLIVDASPSGAVIEIDGKVVGSSHFEGTLASRGYQVIVKKPGYEAWSTEVAIGDDTVRTIKAELIAEKSRSWVWWTVGALAVVGGGIAVGYIVLKPSDQQPINGTFNPATVLAGHRF